MQTRSFFYYFIFLLFSCGNSQERKPDYRLVGGPCEGCEAVFEYGNRPLSSIDTLPEFNTAEKKLKLSGTIYKKDGKTPAENVILYIHHTNAEGVYPTKGDEKNWAKRHGYLRGWVKTGKDGSYTFYTQVPGHYPNRQNPAHIHPFILEPDGKYYYVSAYFFRGDPLLAKDHLNNHSRGSDGVVRLEEYGTMNLIQRDFILGKGIPEYK